MHSSIRFAALVTITSLALMLSACGSGSAGTGGGTTSGTGTTTGATTGAASGTGTGTGDGATTGAGTGTGSPEDAARIFVDAVVNGKDLSGLICSAQAANLQQTLASVAQPGVTVDTSGLTFHTSNTNGDTVQVAVSGTMKLTTQGQTGDVPAPWTTITMQNEKGWKYCG